MSQLISFSPRPAYAFESITVDDTAGGKSLTAATYRKQVGPGAPDWQMPRKAFITVETASIRFSIVPGVAPTATTNGHEIGANMSFEIEGQQIIDFRVIRSTATSATIRVTYFF